MGLVWLYVHFVLGPGMQVACRDALVSQGCIPLFLDILHRGSRYLIIAGLWLKSLIFCVVFGYASFF